MSFSGFPAEAFAFYEGLEADNSKSYWAAHKAVFDSCVLAPMQDLLEELEPTFGAAKMFRPYRDVRFSKDKSPYKTRQYAVVHLGSAGIAGLYVGIDADGLHLGGGLYQASTEQARRMRAAIAEEPPGASWARSSTSSRPRVSSWQASSSSGSRSRGTTRILGLTCSATRRSRRTCTTRRIPGCTPPRPRTRSLRVGRRSPR